jgi:NAD(P)-dependent dehydrogenase (short-subunit alcohol dehydrogenase family)
MRRYVRLINPHAARSTAGDLLKARSYGRIVNIASIAGKEGNSIMSAYSASKVR